MQNKRRQRKAIARLYSLTDEGRAALAAWQHAPQATEQLYTLTAKGREALAAWQQAEQTEQTKAQQIEQAETVTAPKGDIWQALAGRQYVILDTETTGLGPDAEIVEIAIVDHAAWPVFYSLVKPTKRIPADATAIHGITNEDVENAPTFAELLPHILTAIKGRHVIVYNAAYDRRLLHQSAEAADLPKINYTTFSTWHCAMETFARIYGAWSEYHQSYTWQPLAKAVRYYGGEPTNAHRASSDCEMTQFVCHAMFAARQKKVN